MEIILVVHDIRSCHNVGSLLRTADGLGVNHVYLTGYTPYPSHPNDTRLPHLRDKITRQIHKTALGAEDTVAWSQHDSVYAIIGELSGAGYQLLALEQAAGSIPLHEFMAKGQKLAVLIGREVEGIDPELLKLVNQTVEIPMLGRKESLNVVQATAIALYHLRYLAVS